MEVTASTPLCWLLLHLGACTEAVEWAGRRPMTKASLDACPSPEWRKWIADALGVSTSAPWRT